MKINIEAIILIIVFAALIIAIIKSIQYSINNKGSYTKYIENQTISPIQVTTQNNYNYLQYNNYPYKKKTLLTNHELIFYKNLYKLIQPYNLVILAKIRIADLVEVNTSAVGNKYMSYFGKIKAKHIDFALVNPENMEVKALIELDDSSHDKKNRAERDIFVNELFNTTGYKLFRTYGDLTQIANYVNADSTIRKKQTSISVTSSPTAAPSEKLIADLYVRLGKIERILTEVDDKPYIIEKEDV